MITSKQIVIFLILYIILFIEIEALVFISFYEHEKTSDAAVTEIIRVKNSTKNTGENHERMFGIDTGNSETDFGPNNNNL